MANETFYAYVKKDYVFKSATVPYLPISFSVKKGDKLKIFSFDWKTNGIEAFTNTFCNLEIPDKIIGIFYTMGQFNTLLINYEEVLKFMTETELEDYKEEE